MYEKLLKLVNEGQAILTGGGGLHPDIPTIDQIGPGRRLSTDTDVEHYGYGLFVAQVAGAEVSFDGGGEMYRVYDDANIYQFSWTLLRAKRAQLDAMGYDLDKVKAALEHLEQLEREIKAEFLADALFEVEAENG